MQIKERDFNLYQGFAWVLFEDAGAEYSIQACLKERKKCADPVIRDRMIRHNQNIYKKAIDINDDGMDWGLCADGNAKAFAKYGNAFCVDLFRREIKKIGIRFE